ncbi:hypothetical protein SMICM17S_03565 [Streptomyces microflavus]
MVRSEAVRASTTAAAASRSLPGTSSSTRLRPTATRIRSTIAPRTNPAPTAAVAVRAARSPPRTVAMPTTRTSRTSVATAGQMLQ